MSDIQGYIKTIPAKHPRSVLIYHIFNDLKITKLDNIRILKLEDIREDCFELKNGKFLKFNDLTRTLLENWLKYHPGISEFIFCNGQGCFTQNEFSKIFKNIFNMTIIEFRRSSRYCLKS